MSYPDIDPHIGIDLVRARTLEKIDDAFVSVVIPAHNERDTIREVISDARRGLSEAQVEGEIIVSASGCTDDTAERAKTSGAEVVISPTGKGAAIQAGVDGARGDIICLIDGDIRYFGDKPLVTLLIEPLLAGIADACVSDLYWRPLYPQMWMHGFFAPLAGLLFPEMLPKVGFTPWSGQRAALRALWPAQYPQGFTVDLHLLLYWNSQALRLRPVLADDWVNPQRPKPDLMAQELDVLLSEAIKEGRIGPEHAPGIRSWYRSVHTRMSAYRPGTDDPQIFEHDLLVFSRDELNRQYLRASDDDGSRC